MTLGAGTRNGSKVLSRGVRDARLKATPANKGKASLTLEGSFNPDNNAIEPSTRRMPVMTRPALTVGEEEVAGALAEEAGSAGARPKGRRERTRRSTLPPPPRP